MLRGTDKVKLVYILDMLGKEAELEQGCLPSEVNGCVHEGPMDEDTTHVQPFYQLRVEAWRNGSQYCIIDGSVILHRMKSNALGTLVDLSHNFNELLLSMTREYDEIMPAFDTYCKDVSLKYATREVRLQGQRPVLYEIHDETGIEHITVFKGFLYQGKTNDDLADDMAMKVLTYNTD